MQDLRQKLSSYVKLMQDFNMKYIKTKNDVEFVEVFEIDEFYHITQIVCSGENSGTSKQFKISKKEIN